MRDTGHADRYAKLSVNYIDHHNPDLFLFDSDGEEVQRIDLTRLRTTANIHKLLQMYGMKETCKDLNPACADWAAQNQCDANPDYMMQQCRKACNACGPASDSAGADSEPPCVNTAPEHDCEYWSTMGECTANEAFMRTGCARSCGFCTVKERAVPRDDDDELDDDDVYRAKDEL